MTEQERQEHLTRMYMAAQAAQQRATARPKPTKYNPAGAIDGEFEVIDVKRLEDG